MRAAFSRRERDGPRLHFAAACARGGNEGPFLQTDVCFPRAVEECAASRSSNVYGAGPARPQHQTEFGRGRRAGHARGADEEDRRARRVRGHVEPCEGRTVLPVNERIEPDDDGRGFSAGGGLFRAPEGLFRRRGNGKELSVKIEAGVGKGGRVGSRLRVAGQHPGDVLQGCQSGKQHADLSDAGVRNEKLGQGVHGKAALRQFVERGNAACKAGRAFGTSLSQGCGEKVGKDCGGRHAGTPEFA